MDSQIDKNAEDAVLADAAPLAEEPAQAPQVQPQFTTMAVFQFVRADGTSGTDRVFIRGVPALRYVAQIEHFEKMIVDQSQGAYLRVVIIDFKSLEG